MKYFAYIMVWVCTAAVIICAIMFEDAVWTVLGLILPLGIPFPKDDSISTFLDIAKPFLKKEEQE